MKLGDQLSHTLGPGSFFGEPCLQGNESIMDSEKTGKKRFIKAVLASSNIGKLSAVAASTPGKDGSITVVCMISGPDFLDIVDHGTCTKIAQSAAYTKKMRFKKNQRQLQLRNALRSGVGNWRSLARAQDTPSTDADDITSRLKPTGSLTIRQQAIWRAFEREDELIEMAKRPPPEPSKDFDRMVSQAKTFKVEIRSALILLETISSLPRLERLFNRIKKVEKVVHQKICVPLFNLLQHQVKQDPYDASARDAAKSIVGGFHISSRPVTIKDWILQIDSLLDWVDRQLESIRHVDSQGDVHGSAQVLKNPPFDWAAHQVHVSNTRSI